jgi:hypothetical protein
MRRAAAALLIAGSVLALAGAPAVAQEERPPQPADELLGRGETPGWTAVAGLEATGTLASGGREMAFHMWRARDDRFRLELTYRGERQVYVVDGKSGWIQVGSEPPTPLAENQVWERLSWADVFARLPDFYRRYPRRDLEPAVDSLGRPVRPVRLWPRSGYPYVYHVDEQTGRIVGGVRHYYDREDDGVYQAQLYYHDFRELAPGVSMPFTVETDEGTYTQTLQLQEVKLLREPPAAELFGLGGS